MDEEQQMQEAVRQDQAPDDLVERLREPYDQRQSRRAARELEAANRIEALTADLAAERHGHGHEKRLRLEMIEHVAKAETELAAAEAKLAQAVEVLNPFAKEADCRCADSPEWQDNIAIKAVLTIGDLRRVQAFLASLQPKGETDDKA